MILLLNPVQDSAFRMNNLLSAGLENSMTRRISRANTPPTAKQKQIQPSGV